MVHWLVGLIEVHSSWLMTGKNLVSIAALMDKKFEAVVAAAEVPLKFGVSAFNQ